MIRVLVVDDHPVTRDGVRAGLARDGRATMVGEAADAHAALGLVQQTRPDVVLVDLRLAGPVDGVELIRQLGQIPDGPRILVLSQAGPAEVLAAIRAGAHGCVSKAATAGELAGAVLAVLDGPVIPPALAALVIGELRRAPDPTGLTARERDVLRCLAKGYDNREIAEELGVALRTVNRHLENIRAKLGRRRRSELVRFARDDIPPA
jgi:DNA-binding NarL/FixJ family response regulator